MSQHHRPGAHELGQNFLRDHRIIQTIVRLAADGDGRLVEWAAGGGALTLPLAQLHRPLEAVEIDPKHLQRLRRTVPPHVCITKGDILRHAPPAEAWTLVSNVPFHITTPVLRRLLSLGRWDRAVLITQWEVARKRAGVGGTTQLTAQWWPWFTFTLVQRIPASAFSPRPSVDAGLLLIDRRTEPLLEVRGDYQQWVAGIFNGRGRGIREILLRSGGVSQEAARQWCKEHAVSPSALPKTLTAEQWTSAYRLQVRPLERATSGVGRTLDAINSRPSRRQ